MNPLDLLKALNAIDGLLDHGIVILNSEAVSPRSKVVQGLKLFFARMIGMSFITEFKVVKTVSSLEDAIDHFFQVLR